MNVIWSSRLEDFLRRQNKNEPISGVYMEQMIKNEVLWIEFKEFFKSQRKAIFHGQRMIALFWKRAWRWLMPCYVLLFQRPKLFMQISPHQRIEVDGAHGHTQRNCIGPIPNAGPWS